MSREQSGQVIQGAGSGMLQEPGSGETISMSEPSEMFVNNGSNYHSGHSEYHQVPENRRGGSKRSLFHYVAVWMKQKVSRLRTPKRKREKKKRDSNRLRQLFAGDGASSSISQRNSGGLSSINTGETQKRTSNPISRRRTRARDGFILDILLQTASGSCSRRRAKMDTGAEKNLITESAAFDLGFKAKKYIGVPLQPIGPIWRPDYELTLLWSVVEREALYETRFCVVPDKFGRNFDVLIGEDWIVDNEALRRNPEVCN